MEKRMEDKKTRPQSRKEAGEEAKKGSPEESRGPEAESACPKGKKDYDSVDPRTGSLLTEEDIENLEGYSNEEDNTGYFFDMFNYLVTFLRQGLEQRRFTLEQIREDVEFANWYAYSCINIGEYEFYWRACKWLPYSEKNAKGCGQWYYRYSVALMYIGRLEQSYEYALKGSSEEPEYPWNWLQIAKLRSHFEDVTGALYALDKALALEPDDYELNILREEILRRAPIEELEFHWVDPVQDEELQNGLCEQQDLRREAISCIRIDPERFEANLRALGKTADELQDRDGYTTFDCTVDGRAIKLIFKMNKAGFSKIKTSWLESLVQALDAKAWAARVEPEPGKPAFLEAIIVGRDLGFSIFYYPEDGSHTGYRIDLDARGQSLTADEEEPENRTLN